MPGLNPMFTCLDWEMWLSSGRIGRPKAPVEAGVKTTHLVALELFLVFLLGGCASLSTDLACRAGIERETEALYADDGRMGVSLLLSAAHGDELVGDYEGCLKNLKTARRLRRVNNYYAQNIYYPPRNATRNAYSRAGQNQSSGGRSYDAAHHAAGHTHHHGH